MANKLKEAMKQTILTLWKQGWSIRRISRETRVHRDTVSRYVRAQDSKQATLATGVEPKLGHPATGSGPPDDSKQATPATGSTVARSMCTPYLEQIETWLEMGLSATRIHQDLIAQHGFKGKYNSVKRFVRKLKKTTPLPFRRMETLPGVEAQVDFGQGALVEQPNGRRKRPHMFRIVLSCSRKGYTEVVWRQDTDTFMRCLENAFWHFGGVPKTLVVDNLKAAVIEADWYDPELNPKLRDFAEHYGSTIMPTKPYTPWHKGKVEGGVKYAQDNALKGRVFKNLEDQNIFLLDWESRIADHRIHGTTRKQVAALFATEKPHLISLRYERFPDFEEGRRKVHRDGHVEVAKAYYSVPPAYLSREVWVRWDARTVRVYDQQFEQIALHSRKEPGRFSTLPIHIDDKKISGVERGAEYLLGRVAGIGPHSTRWAKALLEKRGVQSLRALQGFLALRKQHSTGNIEQAAQQALAHGVYRLRALRALIKNPQRQETTGFLEEHPLIRDLSMYGELTKVAFHQDGATVTTVDPDLFKPTQERK